MQLVLASGNAGKLAELQALFAGLPLTLVSQRALGIGDAEEPFGTFVENALAKARHAAQASGSAAIADDSGLCVAALGGAPGVRSARYAALLGRDGGAGSVDAQNNAALLERMRELTAPEERRARFISVLVAVRSADDPEPLIATGHWPGTLLHAPQGSGGFGYDPLLYIDALGCSAGELDAATKNRHSHRARASAQMFELMRARWFDRGGD